MYIEHLSVQNFRSLHDVNWKPGRLNVLIGPNGGGKSNVLKTLDMLSAAARGSLAKYVQHEGGIQAISFDGLPENIQFVVTTSKCIYGLLIAPLSKSSLYEIGYEVLKNKNEQVLLDREPRAARIYPERGTLMQSDPINVTESEAALPVIRTAGTQGNRVGSEFVQFLDSWRIYTGLNTCRGSAIRQPAVVSFDNFVDSEGQNLITVLHTLYESHRDFKRDVDLAMKAAFGDEFEEMVFPPAADQRVQLRVRWRSLARPQSTADLSDGTLHFLFLITILASPERPGLIAIEEPEMGLHPSMIQVIADYAAAASEHCQIVLTTHSPVFLNAIGKHNPVMTVVESLQGKTQLRNISGEELNHWMEQFTLGEAFTSGQLESIS